MGIAVDSVKKIYPTGVGHPFGERVLQTYRRGGRGGSAPPWYGYILIVPSDLR